jgi:MbtH protein
MNDDEYEDSIEYQVVLNDEEQYSIWPVDRAVPAGWRTAPCRGPKAACLEYIERVWTDMRPLSLRKQMDAQG